LEREGKNDEKVKRGETIVWLWKRRGVGSGEIRKRGPQKPLDEVIRGRGETPVGIFDEITPIWGKRKEEN